MVVNIYSCTHMICTIVAYREEGPKALYRGFVPKALRLGIGQTTGLLVFQKCISLFGAQGQGPIVREEAWTTEGN